ncbi:hypothetical protein ACI3PL_30975, partial [Lacticaseibacillus paracasei]
STVRIAERLIEQAEIPTDQQDEYQRVLETLPGQGKWSILLPLNENDHGIFVAHAWNQKSKYRPASLQAWQYDADFGLR